VPTEFAEMAVSNLRDGTQFGWYVIPLLILVFHLYAEEIQRKNWSVVFAGLAFWGMDWFNEISNSLVFHFTQYAPIWGVNGGSAYQILIGLNIEICLMFAFVGITAAKTLPEDKTIKILGIPNRWFLGLAGSIGFVFIEYFLNAVDALTWDYRWWNRGSPIPIVLFGYLTFFMVSFWVHDMATIRGKVIAVTAILGFDAACLIVFGGVLGWL
jgi:hypothetical protein